MTNEQMFFSLVGIQLASVGFLKYYIDAKIAKVDTKIDSLAKQVDLLVYYMIEHHGKIASLEERTKK